MQYFEYFFFFFINLFLEIVQSGNMSKNNSDLVHCLIRSSLKTTNTLTTQSNVFQEIFNSLNEKLLKENPNWTNHISSTTEQLSIYFL